MPQLNLDVTGDLQGTCGSECLTISARGEKLIVDMPSFRALWQSAASLGSGKRRTQSLQYLDEMARRTGLSVDMHIAGSPIVYLGLDVKQNTLERFAARIMGLGPVRIRVLSLVRVFLTLLLRRSNKPV